MPALLPAEPPPPAPLPPEPKAEPVAKKVAAEAKPDLPTPEPATETKAADCGDKAPALKGEPAKDLGKTPKAEPDKAAVCPPSGDLFGTTVAFAASPKIAGDEALKQKKLLFVLHVSGNFEDPGFT